MPSVCVLRTLRIEVVFQDKSQTRKGAWSTESVMTELSDPPITEAADDETTIEIDDGYITLIYHCNTFITSFNRLFQSSSQSRKI